MPALLVAGSILIPAILGLQVWLVPVRAFRRLVVLINTLVLALLTAGIIRYAPFRLSMSGVFADTIEFFFVLLDIAVLGYAVFLGWRWNKPMVWILALIQLGMFGWLELAVPGEAVDTIMVDRLTVTLNVIITVIGSLVIIFATRYMDDLEAEGDRPNQGLPRFFAILLVFLGAMNGLISTDNLRFIYLFWELTTLSSYLLISHYKHREASENAFRALWINLLGGAAMLGALILLGTIRNSASLSELVRYARTDSGLMLAVGLLVIAALTKAAQVPFHGWLLGAMVAPTPVSALLHSSTMVNAALYIVFRLSPAIRGSLLGDVTASLGAFSFFAASAMGIGEANAKRVLAFSTIANLGLALCMGALDTPLALTAGVLVLVYHAISKGLLFLAIGSIEHSIGSRQIEKMDRLFEELPITTLIAVLGMLSMMMPPFGVLVGKWLAIEAAVGEPIILLFLIFGSAFTVAFWSKWVGKILATSSRVCGKKIKSETLPLFAALPLSILTVLVVLSSFLLGQVFNIFALPIVTAQYSSVPLYTKNGGLYSPAGGFLPWPIFVVLALVVLSVPGIISRLRCQDTKGPYLCGENTPDEPERSFISARDEVFTSTVGNYYVESIFGEGAVNRWATPISLGLLLLLLGVAR